MLTEQHLRDYDELGYFIVDDAVEPGMTEEMCAAARRLPFTVSIEVPELMGR